jgi:hypothetical protein
MDFYYLFMSLIGKNVQESGDGLNWHQIGANEGKLEIHNQGSQCSGQDSNQTSLKCKSETIPLQLIFSPLFLIIRLIHAIPCNKQHRGHK